ncbi:MAG: TolC family protein [Chlorobiaceae bacterium]|nr:TolC family protein [Chlorobiaceae bacterium]
MRRLLMLGVVLTVLFFEAIPFSPLQAAETLTWQQCLREAAQNHPDLRSAAEAVRQSEAQRSIDRSGLLPTVSVSSGGSRSGNFSNDPAVQNDGSWSMVASASQLLFDGGKTRNTVASTSETIKAKRHAAEVISASTRYSLRTAFVQLLTAQQQVALAADIAQRRRQSLRLIGLLYQSGTENSGALSKARADLAEAEYEVAQAKRGLESSQAVLCTQLGRRAITSLQVTAPFTSTETTRSTPDFDRLVREHPSYLQLASQKEASRYSLQAAKSAFVPKVSLNSSVGNASFSNLPPDRVDWQVGVNVAVPIYQGGSGRATVAQARASLNRQQADEESGYFSLMRTLQQTWKAFRDATENVGVQKQYLDAANERARIADAQYSAGLVSFNDWTIIEDNLVTAKKSYLSARSTLLTSEAAWVQAKGGSFETR